MENRNAGFDLKEKILRRNGFVNRDKPFVVPTTDGKLIEEHFGMVYKETAWALPIHDCSPVGVSLFQNPEFDEYTLVSRGKNYSADGESGLKFQLVKVSLIKKEAVKISNPYAEAWILVFAFPHFLWTIVSNRKINTFKQLCAISSFYCRHYTFAVNNTIMFVWYLIADRPVKHSSGIGRQSWICLGPVE